MLPSAFAAIDAPVPYTCVEQSKVRAPSSFTENLNTELSLKTYRTLPLALDARPVTLLSPSTAE